MSDVNSENGERLTTRDYWADVWQGVKLPNLRAPEADEGWAYKTFLPKRSSLRLLEIGCAPGGWMAYFHKEFGWSVDGIEYVADAAELTRANMEMQSIEAQVWCDDFFSIETSKFDYDVVFSGGFIEHFDDFPGVCRRLSELGRIVVTRIPNLYGVNGLISRTARPHVFDKHVPINLEQLRSAHESNGLNTKFCNYVGGVRFHRIADRNRFFEGRPKLSSFVDLPVKVLNRMSQIANRRISFRPRACWCCPSLLYIGEH